ncbi:MAG TPA: hypothetical protein VKA05_02410, partial [Acidimicrobiales bacterium]|nr:hypothetical protein [Acidimicrobiales bacterium]
GTVPRATGVKDPGLARALADREHAIEALSLRGRSSPLRIRDYQGEVRTGPEAEPSSVIAI